MIARKTLVLALAAAGLVSGGLAAYRWMGEPATRLALAPVNPPLCQSAGARGWASMLMFKAAFAGEPRLAQQTPRPEVKPFDYAIKGTSPAAQGDAVLWDNLGTLSYRITTREPRAQLFFDQGLRLAYAFNHAEALRAFRTAQKFDPQCAMCYWGEAYALGPNINAPMEDAAVEPAHAAVQRAQTLAAKASPPERGLIQALAARYSPDLSAKRAELDAAYADAMAKAVNEFPQDSEITVLFAESIMMLSPWDYWESGGTKPKGKIGEAVAALERVLKLDPTHAGAIHFYIHAVEASSNPGRAEVYADRLGKLMPGAGHLVHMPSHIYYRVGRYLDALAANRKAVAIDEAYLAALDGENIYRFTYYPHNVHFLLAAAQMAGDGRTVVEAARKLDAVIPAETARAIPMVQPMKAGQYFAHVQFSSPQTILALPDPGDEMPYLKAMWHYARGVARAVQGDLEAASAEASAIAQLRDKADLTPLTNSGVPAPDVLRIAELTVQARVAQAQKNLPEATKQFQSAVALQDKLPYMEPPYWYYPVRQSLGAVLLQAGDLDGAEQAFRDSLARAPNNGWSLYGLREVYLKRGDQDAMRDTEELLGQTWIGPREELELPRL